MMQPSRWTLFFLLAPAVGFIFLFLAAAAAMTLLQSLGYMSVTGESRFSLAHWAALADQQFFDAFFFSLKIGIGSAFGTLLVSLPLALFLRRKNYFGIRTVGTMLKIPLFIPALVAAFLLLNIMSFNGIINVALLRLGLIDEPLRMLRDEMGLGVIFIQVWKNLPFQLLIIASVVETIRIDIEDAARNLGASYLSVVRYILLPLAMPGIMIAVILVFIMTFGDFAITKVAGPIYPPSLSVFMFTRASMFQEWNLAACVGVVIIVTSIAFVALYTRIVMAMQGRES
jgi:putative spermidine/putrescine transport system permease protein